jgi:hypothetical protein
MTSLAVSPRVDNCRWLFDSKGQFSPKETLKCATWASEFGQQETLRIYSLTPASFTLPMLALTKRLLYFIAPAQLYTFIR